MADGGDKPAAAEAQPKAEDPPAPAPAPAQQQGKGAGKPKKEKKKKEKKAETGPPLKLEPQPDYIKKRLDLFDKLYAEKQAEIAAKEPQPIKVTLPDGKVVEGQSWRTTPYEVANGISSGLANTTVVAKVNDDLWDLDRPLEGDCTLALLKFSDEDGKNVFWHSSAHVLGEALEQHTGGCLCYGPPIEQGYYYDIHLGEQTLSQDNFSPLNSLCKSVTKQKQEFQRLEMTKEQLLEMFEYNDFKKRIITERVKTPTTTVYRCGDLIDLCRGPHVRNTGKIKAMEVVKTSSTYWEGNADAEVLQRVYGISFPDAKELKEWKRIQEEAAKRDHRKIGTQQELFFFHELSPGSCFFLPKGAFIYNQLVEFIRGQYKVRGFQEVVTPNIYNSKLWETSGHWQHYAEDMFSFQAEDETWALKPMNCPGHCLMFGHRVRSYKELPLRFADFGVLHRNEKSGALTGLTRVRRFQQDDAHIFCMDSQIEQEIAGALDFLQYVYGIFGFTFDLNLSTRPKKYLGEIEVWDRAEAALKKTLDEFGHPWKLNPGDGAFYGPKIDITIKDALKRSHQCATIQLDFQLPQRFELEYVPAEKSEHPSRPVIIHRAILGSVERMIAILIESFAGNWPFWINPRQAQVIPVVPLYNEYAQKVQKIFAHAGFMVDVDVNDSDTLNKKIRNAQMSRSAFAFEGGDAEQNANSVAVRDITGKSHGVRTVDECLKVFAKFYEDKEVENIFPPAEGAEAKPVEGEAKPAVDEAKAE
jgi:threonyl-tRNA synthetase